MSEHVAGQGKADFTGPNTPMQVRLPSDLVMSLKLQSAMSGRSISELVLACLTSAESIPKTWAVSRKAQDSGGGSGVSK